MVADPTAHLDGRRGRGHGGQHTDHHHGGAERADLGRLAAPKRSRSARSRARTSPLTTRPPTEAPWSRWRIRLTARRTVATSHARRCPRQDASGQHHEGDAGQGHQGPGGLGDAQREVLVDEVEVGGRRSADRHQEVEEPGQEDGTGGHPTDPSHPDPSSRHRRLGRPGGAAGPPRHLGRVRSAAAL